MMFAEQLPEISGFPSILCQWLSSTSQTVRHIANVGIKAQINQSVHHKKAEIQVIILYSLIQIAKARFKNLTSRLNRFDSTPVIMLESISTCIFLFQLVMSEMKVDLHQTFWTTKKDQIYWCLLQRRQGILEELRLVWTQQPLNSSKMENMIQTSRTKTLTLQIM